MQRTIFDTHAHYTATAFDNDRHELLQSLPENGVAFVVDCGTDLDTSLQSIALAEQYPWLYTAAGIHPQSLIEEETSTLRHFGGDWRAEMKELEALYAHPKVVAVGECGLDHHWPIPSQPQLELFEAEIKTALEQNLPIIVHDREAHAEIYALLKKYKPRGVLHSFSGSAQDAEWLTAQGMYIGFNGVVTFKNARRPLEAAAAVPDEYLLVETDSPYLAPAPFRGKRTNSSMICYVAEKLAEVRGSTPAAILEMTLQNALRLFNLPTAGMLE